MALSPEPALTCDGYAPQPRAVLCWQTQVQEVAVGGGIGRVVKVCQVIPGGQPGPGVAGSRAREAE